MSFRQVAAALVAVAVVGTDAGPCLASTGYATYYNRASCRRDGTSGITASGEPLSDGAMTCASWDHPFGTVLRVTCLESGRSVIVRVNDHGPGRKARRRGVIVDLTEGAFRRLGSLGKGRVHVRVEEVE
jgi:rare lipoprotein A